MVFMAGCTAGYSIGAGGYGSGSGGGILWEVGLAVVRAADAAVLFINGLVRAQGLRFWSLGAWEGTENRTDKP